MYVRVLLRFFIDNSEYDENRRDKEGYHVPNAIVANWSPEKIGTGNWFYYLGKVTLYKTNSENISYNMNEYKHVMVPEFGHVLGLEDAYASAHNGLQLVSNAEVIMADISYNERILMCNNGDAYSNDI